MDAELIESDVSHKSVTDKMSLERGSGTGKKKQKKKNSLRIAPCFLVVPY